MRFSARLAQALASQDPDGAALWAENRPITWGEFRRGIADRRRVWEYTTAPGATLRLRVANTPESITELLAALLSERVPILHNAHHPVPDKDEALPVRTSETLLFLHSSGTTGREKLIGLTQTQMAAALSTSQPHSTSRSPSLICHPVGHIAGWWALALALTSGRGVVLLPRFSPQPWAQAVKHHGIRATFLVPSALRILLDAEIPAAHLTSLRLLTTGAATCSPQLIADFWYRYRIPVLNTYGATEFGGSVAGWDRKLFERWWPHKAGSVGRAHAGVDIAVAPEDAPTPGTLRIRGAQTLGRWVETTDLGHVDAEGFVWLDGRTDDIIIRGGFKINPDRVAEALTSHPEVADATVVGLPDSRLGMVPGAVVTLDRPEAVSIEQLQMHCRERLAPYECPARFVLSALPRTTAGKLRREDLLRLFDGPLATS